MKHASENMMCALFCTPVVHLCLSNGVRGLAALVALVCALFVTAKARRVRL